MTPLAIALGAVAFAGLAASLAVWDSFRRALATQERMTEQRALADVVARIDEVERSSVQALEEAQHARRAAEDAKAKAAFAGRRR